MAEREARLPVTVDASGRDQLPAHERRPERRRPAAVARSIVQRRHRIRQNSLPTTAAAPTTAAPRRSAGPARAASSAWMVGGIARAPARVCPLAHQCQHLLHEQRVAGRPLDQLGAYVARRRAPRRQARRSARGVVAVRERLERDRLRSSDRARPGRAPLEELLAREASSISGASRGRSDRCSIRSSSSGSAQWMSSKTSTTGRRRASASNRTPHRPREVRAGGAALREAHRLHDALGDLLRVPLAGQQLRDRRPADPRRRPGARSRPAART